MKKIVFVLALISIANFVVAQTVDMRRKIEVTGSAEQEVTPDIIYVSISLQEYLNGKTKVQISDLEHQLEKAVADAGIPKADFTISNVSAANYNWQKKKNPDFLASKQYQIKFHDLNSYNQILAAIDPKGIEYTNINRYDYSKIADLKRDLKIKALLAARDKATYLLSSIGEKLGSALDIQEIDNESYPQPMYRATNLSFNKSAEPTPSDIDVKQIKLNYQVRATFEIVK
jgi:uncharacterized protein YggE